MERTFPGTSGGKGAQRSSLHHVHDPERWPHRHRGEGTAVSTETSTPFISARVVIFKISGSFIFTYKTSGHSALQRL